MKLHPLRHVSKAFECQHQTKGLTSFPRTVLGDPEPEQGTIGGGMAARETPPSGNSE